MVIIRQRINAIRAAFDLADRAIVHCPADACTGFAGFAVGCAIAVIRARRICAAITLVRLRIDARFAAFDEAIRAFPVFGFNIARPARACLSIDT
jgi:hypothetical protein